MNHSGTDKKDTSPVPDAVQPPRKTFRAEADGSAVWSYSYPLTKKESILEMSRTLGILLLITLAIIAGAFAIASPPGQFLNTLLTFFWVFLMIAGIYAISIPLCILVYRGVYEYAYYADENSLTIMEKPSDHSRDKAVLKATVTAASAADTNVSGAAGLLAAYRLGRTISFSSVRSVKPDEIHHAVSLRGFLILTKVYANPADYEAVLSFLRRQCTKEKSRTL